MKIKVEKLEKSEVKITVTVPAETFNKGLDAAFEEVVKTVEVDGFRKGKVPRKTYETKFGVESLYEKAVNYCVSISYEETIQNENIEAVAKPIIDFKYEDLAKDKEFTYEATVVVKPEVKLGEYKELKVKLLEIEVTKEDIEHQKNILLANESELVVKETDLLEKGDTAIFDFEGFKDGETFEGGKADNYSLEMGSGQFIPGFEDQMLGLKVGEKKEINVTFPETYQVEELAGAPVVFNVTLNEIKVSKAPEITDEFVAKLDIDCDKASDLEATIEKKIIQSKEVNRKNKKIDDLAEQAIANATVEVPQVMVDEEIDKMLDSTKQQAKQYGLELEAFLQFQGTTPDKYRLQLADNALKGVKFQLVFEAIANKEEIYPTDEQFEKAYDQIAKTYNVEVKKVKEVYTNEMLVPQLKVQTALEFVVENAIVE